MALFREQQLINRVRNELVKGFTGTIYESVSSKARAILEGQTNLGFQTRVTSYDIFLSHSSNDAEKVAGLKLELQDLGYTVYVDWIDDPQLDRSKITKSTAIKLKERMHKCQSLFYAFSENSPQSKWMPWELGYFDGIKKKAAVLPITKVVSSQYSGTEYLGVYYYITKEPIEGSSREYLWVNENRSKYILYDKWLKENIEPYDR